MAAHQRWICSEANEAEALGLHHHMGLFEEALGLIWIPFLQKSP